MLDCFDLSDEALECNEGNFHQPYYLLLHHFFSFSVFTITVTNCTIVCHEHFCCDNNFCKPRCDWFTIYSDEYVKLSDGLMITSGYVGMLCGIAVVASDTRNFKNFE